MDKFVAVILIIMILVVYLILIFKMNSTLRKIKKDHDKIIKLLGAKDESHLENQQYMDDIQRRRW